MKSPTLGLILAISYCCVYVKAYPNGAPSSTCAAMRPYHAGATDSKDPPPYQINVEKVRCVYRRYQLLSTLPN